jgi:glutathione S-transferase
MKWFSKRHPEPVPSAVDRYVAEINRVTGVVESHLAAQKAKASSGDGPWLVGDKLTFADLAWFMWQVLIEKIIPDKGENWLSLPPVPFPLSPLLLSVWLCECMYVMYNSVYLPPGFSLVPNYAEYPNVKEWLDKLRARKSIQYALEIAIPK